MKYAHTYRTKPVKAVINILGNKTLLRYFRNFNNTYVDENFEILENFYKDTKVPCFPINLNLVVFYIALSFIFEGPN